MKNKRLIRALRRAGQRIEEHGCGANTGMCFAVASELEALGGVCGDAYYVLRDFTYDQRTLFDEVYAYPLSRRYDGARALAAYCIAEFMERGS